MFTIPWEKEQDRWGHQLIYIRNISGSDDEGGRLRTHLGEPVRTRRELPQLHIEVFIICVFFLRLQVMVSLRASWELMMTGLDFRWLWCEEYRNLVTNLLLYVIATCLSQLCSWEIQLLVILSWLTGKYFCTHVLFKVLSVQRTKQPHCCWIHPKLFHNLKVWK